MIELSMMDQIAHLKYTKFISTYTTDFMSLVSIFDFDEKSKLISF